MVQISHIKPIQYSFSPYFDVSAFKADPIQGILVDFKTSEGHSHISTKNFYERLTDKDVLVIRCSLPSAFIVEIMMLIVKTSRHHRVVVWVDEISSDAFRVLKVLGLTELFLNQFTVSAEKFQYPRIITDLNQSNTGEQVINLSITEFEILYLISKGFKNAQIAALINRSYHTIKNHKTNIIRKTGLDHCYQLIELVNDLKLNFA